LPWHFPAFLSALYGRCPKHNKNKQFSYFYLLLKLYYFIKSFNTTTTIRSDLDLIHIGDIAERDVGIQGPGNQIDRPEIGEKAGPEKGCLGVIISHPFHGPNTPGGPYVF
jgi:hypothetical protein